MKKRSQDKGDGGEHRNNEKIMTTTTKRMKRGSQDEGNDMEHLNNDQKNEKKILRQRQLCEAYRN
jgi:hypothetical protein